MAASASASSSSSSMAAAAASIAAADVARLRQHTACDVSDALLKLNVPAAGFIADLNAYGSAAPDEGAAKTGAAKTIAPVSTVLFVAKGEAPAEPASNLPADAHWSDATEPDTFVVMRQPPGQANAVLGGIMALRIKVRGAKGIAVAGRVRDLAELRSTNLPILAYGTSTVGAGGGSAAWALQVPLEIGGVTVRPGDVAFHDPDNGLVVIPRDRLRQVLDLLPGLVAADDKVKEDVRRGRSVHEAFARHRRA